MDIFDSDLQVWKSAQSQIHSGSNHVYGSSDRSFNLDGKISSHSDIQHPESKPQPDSESPHSVGHGSHAIETPQAKMPSAPAESTPPALDSAGSTRGNLTTIHLDPLSELSIALSGDSLDASGSVVTNWDLNQVGAPPNHDEDLAALTNGLGAPADELEHGFLPVFKNWNFLVLWSGQIFSQMADKVYLVLVIGLIASRFQAAGQPISGWVSALMIVFTIPAILFGSLAGVFVDRWPKKLVLVSTNVLRGGLVLMLPGLLWLTAGWDPVSGLPIGFFMLLAVTFWVSTLTQFFAPAEQAIIPLVVQRRHLLSANSLYTTTMMASVIIGFALGEPLLAIADTLTDRFSAQSGMGRELLVGLGYIVAGGLLLLIRPQEKTEHLEREHPHVLEDIRDGLRYLGQNGHVRAALLQLVILFSIFAAFAVLAVRVAEIMPALESDQFGFLLAAGGVGMAIGAGLIGQFCQRFSRAQLSLLGSIGVAAGLVALSCFIEQLVPALICIMLVGSFAALVGIPMQTTIQAETPESMRGKVFGLQNNAVNIALSLPLALASIAENFLGLRAVFVGLAALAIAGGVVTWYISRKGTVNVSS